jgi:hypothetical protein
VVGLKKNDQIKNEAKTTVKGQASLLLICPAGTGSREAGFNLSLPGDVEA